MNVLLLGASGLIGRHLASALARAGCNVIGAGRAQPAGTAAQAWRTIDFAAMTNAQAWLPLLDGVDVVVNCVGLIREARAGEFDLLQRAVPVALFAACELRATARVIQVSALGSAIDAPTGYWRSKGAADADLLRRRLDATVVRLSLVYADDGASSRLLLALAALPALAIPFARRTLVQPVHIDDLTAALATLVMADGAAPRELAIVGPRALTMAAYLAALRHGLGAAPAPIVETPLPLARLAAAAAALHPASTLTPDALAMLVYSADGRNTADAGPTAALLGRAPRAAASFANPAQRPAAVLSWGLPLLRLAFAILWLVTALVSWFGWPHQDSAAWLAACGVPAALRVPTLLGASLLDGAIGLALLLRPRRWLWPFQLALVTGYTVVMSLCLPAFWLHPFGPLSKNLPLIAMLCVMWQLTEKRK